MAIHDKLKKCLEQITSKRKAILEEMYADDLEFRIQIDKIKNNIELMSQLNYKSNANAKAEKSDWNMNIDSDVIKKAIAFGYEKGCRATEGGCQDDPNRVADELLQEFLEQTALLDGA